MIDLRAIPIEFIRNTTAVNWREFLWAYDREILGWKSVVDFAVLKILEGSDDEMELQMAGYTKSGANFVGELLRKLAGRESFLSEESIKEKWAFITTSWIYINRNDFKDPLKEIEYVFAVLGHPLVMWNFIRFLPPNDGYDPQSHNKEENVQRLYENWEKFINRKKDLNL